MDSLPSYKLIDDILISRIDKKAVLTARIQINDRIIKITWNKESQDTSNEDLKNEFTKIIFNSLPLCEDIGLKTKKISVTKEGEIKFRAGIEKLDRKIGQVT